MSILASNMPNADDVVVEDAVPPPVYVQMILPIAVFMFSVSYGAGMGPAIGYGEHKYCDWKYHLNIYWWRYSILDHYVISIWHI